MKHFSWELTDYLYCQVIWFWRASCFYNVIKVQPFSRVFPQRSIENKYKLPHLIYHSFAHILCNFADVILVPILSHTWYSSRDGQQGWAQGDGTLGRGARRLPERARRLPARARMRTSHTKRCPAKTSEERLKIVIGGLCNRGGRLLGSLFAAYLCECLVIDNVFLKIN